MDKIEEARLKMGKRNLRITLFVNNRLSAINTILSDNSDVPNLELKDNSIRYTVYTNYCAQKLNIEIVRYTREGVPPHKILDNFGHLFI